MVLTRDSKWNAARAALVVLYVIAYLVWVYKYGLIIDRISVVISVTLVMVLVQVGRSWRSWGRLAIDLALYSAMWFAFDETRGAADRFGSPLQVESVRNIDRALFFGADPTVWMQQRFFSSTVRWYDVLASITYYSHFVVPVAVILVLWIWNRSEWIRFMRRMATVLAVACVSFILLPTAPPWMAGGGDRRIRLDALPRLRRPAGRGWKHIGLDGFVHAWETGRDWTNTVAAMPSLHAAFSLLIVCFFFPTIRAHWARGLLLAYPLIMGISLVYLAEHYVIDVLAGWAVVGVACAVWARLERRREVEPVSLIPDQTKTETETETDGLSEDGDVRSCPVPIG